MINLPTNGFISDPNLLDENNLASNINPLNQASTLHMRNRHSSGITHERINSNPYQDAQGSNISAEE